MQTHSTTPELPLLAVTGRSGAGKTTLLTALLPRLREAGLRVAAVKQARADFEVDRPGKDSWRLRQAGAAATIVASGRRWAMFVEEPEDGGGPDLRRLLSQLGAEHLDLVLLEGFAHEPVPRIDVRRHPVDAPAPAGEDARLVAVATDRPGELVASVPVLDLGDACEIQGFVLGWLGTGRAGERAAAGPVEVGRLEVAPIVTDGPSKAVVYYRRKHSRGNRRRSV